MEILKNLTPISPFKKEFHKRRLILSFLSYEICEIIKIIIAVMPQQTASSKISIFMPNWSVISWALYFLKNKATYIFGIL